MNPAPSRDEVFAVVRTQTKEVIDGLTDEALAGATSLSDLGATSLDIVEIVSISMRRLRVKVPRMELMLCENLDELVDVLHRHAVAQAELPAASPENPPTPPPVSGA
jgi:acyl carrier protein